MKKTLFILAIMLGLALAGAARAADTRVHVVSGKVMLSSATMVKIRAPLNNMEFTRDQNTKVVGDIKKGAQVTITYKDVAGMPHATEVDVVSK